MCPACGHTSRGLGGRCARPAAGGLPRAERDQVSAGGLAAAMPVGGQVELVGPLNWLIRSAGLVSWDDLFDAGGDPREFDQVVRGRG